MAIDLEAIRRKIEKLKSVKNSRVQFWKPDPGEYVVRIVPFKDAEDDDPFKHLTFYYIQEGKPGVLAPFQFDKYDPVQELSRQLWSGNEDEKKLARNLKPNTRHYALVIDRSNEEKGVQLWSFGKTIYNRLLGFFINPDIGDYIDPDEGFDLEVKIYKEGGKQYNTTEVDVARKQSILTDDEKKKEEWLNSEVGPMTAYSEKSTEEIQKILDDWLAQGSEEDDPGTEKGTDKSSLDDAIKSLKPESADSDEDKEVEKKKTSAKKKSSSKKSSSSEDSSSAESESKKKIDEVFDEVLNK